MQKTEVAREKELPLDLERRLLSEPGALCFSPENILLCSEGPAQICTSMNATVTTHNPRALAFVARDEPEWQIEFPPDNEMAVDTA